MRKYILLSISLLFLAFTFTGNPPAGWYVLPNPTSDQINDMYFSDTLHGWYVTDGNFNANDTSWIVATTNGGTNWSIQYGYRGQLNCIWFADNNTGYASGGLPFSVVFKTTNGGMNWVKNENVGGLYITGMSFVNKDTGWVCGTSPFNGFVTRTTNGGDNWVSQWPFSNTPQSTFFINNDTGWVGTDEALGKLYRTTNGGTNWQLQLTATTRILSIFFLSPLKGWAQASSATNNAMMYTTNGGLNWMDSHGVNGGYHIRFVNDSVGWAGGGGNPLRVIKSTDGGKNWGYQFMQTASTSALATFRNNVSLAYGGSHIINKTNDGGGSITFTGINQISSEIPISFKLHQNYPNPFNPSTKINYQLLNSDFITLKVFDIQGKEIASLVNEKQNAGTYSVDFDAQNLVSGIYFYSLQTKNFTDTKKMILVK
jgi:photosystem II stability/assembly factor-like uncharacterized protein